jgi:hypothetical protein
MPHTSATKSPGIAHLFLILLVVVFFAGGIGAFLSLNSNPSLSGSRHDATVAGAEDASDDEATADSIQSVLLNGRFKTPATQSNEIARYWSGYKGLGGNVNFRLVRLNDTTLGKAEAVFIEVIKSPTLRKAQIIQRNVNLEPNTKYNVRFAANSRTQGKAYFLAKDSGYIRENLAPQVTFNLTPGWHLYEAEIRTKRYDTDKLATISLVFAVPNASGITLDNFYIFPSTEDDDPDQELDTDEDGINDNIDVCPNQPQGSNPDPDRLGCPLDEEDPTDMDGDGVVDTEDLCPNTPQGQNPDPERRGCPQQTGTKKAKKWTPGHYMSVGSSGELSRMGGNEYRNIKGFRIKAPWGLFEGPNKGDYHFQNIDRMLEALPPGKKLFLMVEDRPNKGRCKIDMPAYIHSSREYSNTVGTNGCMPKLWEAATMDRLIALYKEIGQRYDNDPRFMGIMNQETANPNIPRDKADDFARQLARFHREIAPYFEKTHVFQTMNHLGNGDEPEDGADNCTPLNNLALDIQPLGHGLTNPDTVIWDALPWNCKGRPSETYSYPGLQQQQGQSKGDKPKPMYFVFRNQSNKMPIATGPDTSQYEDPLNPRTFNGERMNFDNMAKYIYKTGVTGYTYTPSGTNVTPFGANFIFWASDLVV